jgi:DNA-binding transcriptional MocR family regulator
MRQRYRERREALLEVMDTLAHTLTPLPSSYGMHLSAIVSDGIDTEAVAEFLQQRQIRLHTLNRYYHGAVDRLGFVFGLGATEPEQIRGLAEALACALTCAKMAAEKRPGSRQGSE